MQNLTQILAAYPSVLVLDAASEVVQVGWLRADAAPTWVESRETAGIGVFRAIQALNLPLFGVKAFIFCEGPGSILGIRTVAMAIRTWQADASRPAFAYSSLALASVASGRPGLSVIADARRAHWHHYQPETGLTRVPAEALGESLATPDGFKAWSPRPPGVLSVPYSVKDALAAHPEYPFFRETEAPDAFLHEEPAYAGWTPQIHKAP